VERGCAPWNALAAILWQDGLFHRLGQETIGKRIGSGSRR
jgi:hypothetical protein